MKKHVSGNPRTQGQRLHVQLAPLNIPNLFKVIPRRRTADISWCLALELMLKNWPLGVGTPAIPFTISAENCWGSDMLSVGGWMPRQSAVRSQVLFDIQAQVLSNKAAEALQGMCWSVPGRTAKSCLPARHENHWFFFLVGFVKPCNSLFGYVCTVCMCDGMCEADTQ